MSLSSTTTVLLLAVLLSGIVLSERTKMLVFDSGTATVYRVDLGAHLTDQSVTSYNIPALQGFNDVEWDFLNDRLYILTRGYSLIQSVFLNGTDLRNVTELEQDSYAIAIAPDVGKLYASMLGMRDEPAKIVSMDIDGSNLNVLREAEYEAPAMGIDYKNKYVYWTEYLCSCLWRVKYDEENAEVEKPFSHIYVKQSPHAIDFERKLLYGDARDRRMNKDGLWKVDLTSGDDDCIYSYRSKYSDQTVYDPKTDRLFFYNDEDSTEVQVLSTNGTVLGTLEGISLTADQEKAIRINPQ